MQVQEFILPIRIKIVANDAKSVVREVSETIYDSVQETIERAIADGSCDHFDMDFSIHRKMTDDEFGHPTGRDRTAYIPGKQAGGHTQRWLKGAKNNDE